MSDSSSSGGRSYSSSYGGRSADESVRTSSPSSIGAIAPRPFVPPPSEPIQNWSHIGQVQARCYKHKRDICLDELLRKISTKQPFEFETINSISVKVGNPINDDRGLGRSDDRLHFRAWILSPEGYRLRVVKCFKSHLGRNSIEHYFNQMEVQTVADHMAREFNKRVGETDPGTLRLLSVKQVRFSTPATTIEAGSGLYYNMEEDLQGSWIKYSDNVGYVNSNEYAATLQAFAHWTYNRSGGVLMVTDIQGVYLTQNSAKVQTDSFLLCDPAIHCLDIMRFTGTNKGEAGFNLFFQSHQCNDICRHLGLPYIIGYPSRLEHPTLRPPTATEGNHQDFSGFFRPSTAHTSRLFQLVEQGFGRSLETGQGLSPKYP